MQSTKSIKTLQAELLDGSLKLIDHINSHLAAIEKSKDLNIYIEVFEEEIKSAANALQDKIEKSPTELGKLFGVVFSIKDVLCYKDHKVTAASKILDGFESQFTATAIQRILDEDGLIIGRTNCDEFAMGSSNENSVYGVCKNGHGENRVPGGSSGGAAVSVQMHTCDVALGTDTGGSVRQPAAFCGVVGMKPTYGRISRYGLIAYASSFDQLGLLGHYVEDIARVLEIVAGKDEFDATSSSKAIDSYAAIETIKNKKFAYFNEVVDHPKLNENIKSSTFDLFEKLRSEGHAVNDVEFEYLDYLVPTYYVLTTAEASSNLSRYDGVRYGHRSEQVKSFNDLYQKTRTEGFGLEVKRRVMLGTFVLSSGYYDAYYSKAQKVRNKISKSISKLLEEYDYIVMPTTTDIAWEIGAFDKDPVAIYLSDVFTVLANLCGLPAISVPLGKDSDGHSYGIQLISSKYNEAKLLNAAFSFQRLV